MDLATSPPEIQLLLQSVPPFAGSQLAAVEWQSLLQALEVQSFTESERIFRQGDEGAMLYIVLQGRVQIQVDGLPVQDLTVGDYFGEMALLDAQPRSASAAAHPDCRCLVLSQKNLQQILQAHPTVALEMLRVMAQRLRQLSRLLNAFEDLAQSQQLLNRGGSE